MWDVKEPTQLFEKSRGRRPPWCGQRLRVVGLGRDGTLHGTYEFRSCLFPLGRPVSKKAGKTKKQNKTKQKLKQSLILIWSRLHDRSGDQMKHYMERRVTPPKRVTSTTLGPPSPCKQAQSQTACPQKSWPCSHQIVCKRTHGYSVTSVHTILPIFQLRWWSVKWIRFRARFNIPLYIKVFGRHIFTLPMTSVLRRLCRVFERLTNSSLYTAC